MVLGVGLVAGCPGAGPASTAAATTSSEPGSTGVDATSTGPVSATDGVSPTSSGEATTGEASGATITAGTTMATETGEAGCPELAPMGMWVWQPAAAQDPGQTAQLLEFAAQRGVTHVYLESELLLAEDPARLAAFIAEADAACVAVELLFGAADWTHTENHGVPLALVEDALDLVDGFTGARPVGLHFDIEPHGLPDWGTHQAQYAGEYLDLLEAMAAKMAGSELSLTVDIAFWYDTVTIERDGATRPLNELVQDRVDRVVLMDYRDHAEPPDGLIDNAATEIEYAGQIGGLVRVAVETTCGLEPEKITFCEEGAIAMSLALGLTASIYAESPGWDGVAVHDYAAWSVLMD